MDRQWRKCSGSRRHAKKEGRGCHHSVNLAFAFFVFGETEKRVRKRVRKEKGSRGKEDRKEGEGG